MEISVFNFDDYKDYLRDRLVGRGQRSLLAQTLGCQTAFVSKVLNAEAHFSLEHAVHISLFLQHTEDERAYFLQLVHLARAGSELLRKHYKDGLKKLKDKYKKVAGRIEHSQGLGLLEQMTYYSSWHYAALHVLASIPAYAQSKKAMAGRLGISLERTGECLEFLVKQGILALKQNGYEVLGLRFHLGQDSGMLARHHTNWRLRAMQSLERPSDEDLHYSSVISLSHKDVEKIREVFLAAIQKSDQIMRPSSEETAFCINLDFFPI